MDSKSAERLNNILTKSPENLTEEEIRFLRARRSYLKTSQVEEYQSVLETKPPKETVKQNGKKTK